MSSERRRRWRAPHVVQLRARQLRREMTTSRTRWLNEQNYRVLRFTNQDVHQNIEAVLERISAVLNDPWV